MEAIPRHQNVLPLVSFLSTPDASFFALPLALGGDTLQLMQDRHCVPLPEADARLLFTQLVRAVEHLHNSGIVHRDIKCENLLLTGTDRRHLLLADFGFATRYIKGQRALSATYGSLHYSSPEICGSLAYEGPEVDVWSMGVVLYAWCTGRLPFGGESEDEITARIRTASFPIPASFSAELAALMRCVLVLDPSKRITIADLWQQPWMTEHAPNPTAALPVRRTSLASAEMVAAQRDRRRSSLSDLIVPTRLTKAVRRIFRK